MKKKESYNYFDEFLEVTNCIVRSANTLKALMEEFDIERLHKDINEVHRLEHESDEIVHRMRNYLIKDFLPPIDREDIALIINKLDNIEDGIDEILINIRILDIKEIKPEVIELINVLVDCCAAVKEMFKDFSNLKNTELIKQKVIKVNKYEELGDRIYEKLINMLYRTELDPITIIKWSNIYNCLEQTIDSCEEIGDYIEDVIMKNS